MMNTICPKCLEDATQRIDLGDGDTVTCTGCDEEYSVDAVRKLIASWGPLLGWLDAHPSKNVKEAV